MQETSGATLSPPSHASLERLAASVRDLLAAIDRHPLAPDLHRDVGENVRRYLAILIGGWSTADVPATLRGANLLTTVDKGVADAATAGATPAIGEKAFAVTRAAIAAARQLRADAGTALP